MQLTGNGLEFIGGIDFTYGSEPPPPSNDPYFNYVSMLLPGSGTNNTTNSTFLDSSTNNFTVSKFGNVTQGSVNPYGTLWSNYFDGSDAYLSIPDNNIWAIPGDFTFEAWVLPVKTGTIMPILAHWPGINPTFCAFLWQVNSDRTLGFAYGVGSTNTGTGGTTQTVTVGQWNHVAVTRSGTTLRFFVNGVQDATTPTVSGTFNNSPGYLVNIGAAASGVSGYFHGFISNLRAVIGTALYTSSFTPPTSTLTAVPNTALLTCQNKTFIDNSTNNFPVTRYSDAAVSNFSPFISGSPYSLSNSSGGFDGGGDYLTIPNNSALILGSSDFTIEGWIYPSGTLGGSYQLAGIWVSGQYSWQLGIGTSNQLFFNINGSGFFASPNNSVTPNAWTYVAVTRSGTSWTMWINGLSAATTTSSATVNNSTTQLYIGANQDAGIVWYFPGYMTSFRIVKGTAVYNAPFTPPTAPLTAITNTQLLLNYSNDAIYDAAAIANLETIGNVKVSTDQSKWGTGSIAFDGTGDYLVSYPTPVNNFNQGNYTVEFWLYLNVLPTVGTATVLSDFYISNSNLFILRVNSNGAISLFQDVGTGAAELASSSGAVTTSVWQYVAFSQTGSTLKMFVNGNEVASGTPPRAYPNGTCRVNLGFTLGSSTQTWARALNGYMNDFRITKGIGRYTTNFIPPTEPLPTF